MAVLKDVEISVLGDIVDSLEMSSTMFLMLATKRTAAQSAGAPLPIPIFQLVMS